MNRTPQIFNKIEVSALTQKADSYKKDGWRFAQLCGSNVIEGVELLYTFSRDAELENLVLITPPKSTVPSISEIYTEAFVYENETHDLFGISFDGLILDFGGTFFEVPDEAPMFEVVTPKEPKAKPEKKEKPSDDSVATQASSEEALSPAEAPASSNSDEPSISTDASNKEGE